MAADAPYSSIPWRVGALETRVDAHDKDIRTLVTSDATLATHVENLTTSTDALKTAMDKVLWGLVGLCITIAGSAVGALLLA
ncbi:MAG: hypothetical protein ACXVGC_09790 [Mycobacteriaceae bacterium]